MKIHCAEDVPALRGSVVSLLWPHDCSPPGSSVHGILLARILEWDAISSSRGYPRPKAHTCVSYIFCIGKQIFYHWRHLGSPQLKIKMKIVFTQKTKLIWENEEWSPSLYQHTPNRVTWMGNSLFPLTQIMTFFCILFWLIGIKVLVWSWELHDWQFTEESTNLCKAQWFCGGKSLLKYLHQKEQQPRDYLWAVSVDSGTFFSCTPGISSLFTIWNHMRDFVLLKDKASVNEWGPEKGDGDCGELPSKPEAHSFLAVGAGLPQYSADKWISPFHPMSSASVKHTGCGVY